MDWRTIIRIGSLLVSILFGAWRYFGEKFLSMVSKKVDSYWVILYYHEVATQHKEKFVKQLDDIERFCVPVSAGWSGCFESGKNYISVTFDDGFASLIDNAIPELVIRRIPFTVFVPAAIVGKKVTWMKDSSIVLKGEKVMGEDQLKEIRKNQFSLIGSHGMTHSKLTLLSEDAAKHEILESKIQLEKILGERISLISFPYGAYDEKILDLAKTAGYSRVFSISPELAVNNPGKYVTGRIRVDPDDWPIEFRLKILGAYRWQPVVQKVKQRFFKTFMNTPSSKIDI